jgi:2-polyprenyl-3-methyl-5-hydroxy-6-metoxy-1,4-benzoquinol methylase
MTIKPPRTPSFDINSFEERLAAKNRFDGNLRHGAKHFHQETNRSGVGRPSSGYLIPEHAKVVEDTGRERYVRKGGIWESVSSCPVCGSEKRHHFLHRMGLDIYRCENCTHRYMDPRVSFAAIGEIYRDDKTAADIYTQPLQIEIDEIKYQYGLDLIDQLRPPAREKIMDVGCGAGLFLKVCDRNGWGECIGIDMNARYNDIYRQARGIQYVHSSFERMDPDRIGRDYDVISMWNVLEHLYDLHGIVSRLNLMLKRGGLLFIMVPNADSLASRLMRERSPTFNWKHVCHFSPRSLRLLMEVNDFECAHYETAITEIDNIKSYMSGEYPYHGHGDPEHLFDFITPEYLHRHHLGSRQIAVFRKP